MDTTSRKEKEGLDKELHTLILGQAHSGLKPSSASYLLCDHTSKLLVAKCLCPFIQQIVSITTQSHCESYKHHNLVYIASSEQWHKVSNTYIFAIVITCFLIPTYLWFCVSSSFCQSPSPIFSKVAVLISTAGSGQERPFEEKLCPAFPALCATATKLSMGRKGSDSQQTP